MDCNIDCVSLCHYLHFLHFLHYFMLQIIQIELEKEYLICFNLEYLLIPSIHGGN